MITITMTVEGIKELHFTEEASVERIEGVDCDCLVDAFDDPDQSLEARLFENLYGWNQGGVGGRSTGIIWYDLRRGGVLVLTKSEIYLFEVKDPATFPTCLTQIRTAFSKQ
jgi:hypothetical protein